MLSVVHFNAQGVRNKSNHIESVILNNCDILCVSEHWLNEMKSSVYKLEDWNTVAYFSRKNFKNGGVILLCKNILYKNCIPIQNLVCVEKDIEITACCFPVIDVRVAVIYRSPSGNISVFLDQLEKNLNVLTNLGKNVL